MTELSGIVLFSALDFVYHVMHRNTKRTSHTTRWSLLALQLVAAFAVQLQVFFFFFLLSFKLMTAVTHALYAWHLCAFSLGLELISDREKTASPS